LARGVFGRCGKEFVGADTFGIKNCAAYLAQYIPFERLPIDAVEVVCPEFRVRSVKETLIVKQDTYSTPSLIALADDFKSFASVRGSKDMTLFFFIARQAVHGICKLVEINPVDMTYGTGEKNMGHGYFFRTGGISVNAHLTTFGVGKVFAKINIAMFIDTRRRTKDTARAYETI